MSAGCGTVCSSDSCYCFHWPKRTKEKATLCYALVFGLKPIKVALTKEAKKFQTWFGEVTQTLTFWLLVGMEHHNAWHHSSGVSPLSVLQPECEACCFAASTLVKASGFFFGVCNCLCSWDLLLSLNTHCKDSWGEVTGRWMKGHVFG